MCPLSCKKALTVTVTMSCLAARPLLSASRCLPTLSCIAALDADLSALLFHSMTCGVTGSSGNLDSSQSSGSADSAAAQLSTLAMLNTDRSSDLSQLRLSQPGSPLGSAKSETSSSSTQHSPEYGSECSDAFTIIAYCIYTLLDSLEAAYIRRDSLGA